VRKKGKLGERTKKESVKIGDLSFALNFWVSLTGSTLQQSRIPFQKS